MNLREAYNRRRLYFAVVSSVAGFLIYGSITFFFLRRTYSFSGVIPVFASLVMALLWRGERDSLYGIPILSLLYALFFLKAQDPSKFLMSDVLNYALLNRLIVQHISLVTFLWHVLVGVIVSFLYYKLKNNKIEKIVAYGILGFLLINLILQCALYNPTFFQAYSSDSKSKILQNDNSGYKRIYFRVCQGWQYYPAYYTTWQFDRGKNLGPYYSLGYRLPGFFMLLKYATQGVGILIPIYFTLLSCVAVLSAFFISKKFLPIPESLISPILVSPFFAYGVASWHLMMMEYWCIFLMFIAISLWLYQKEELATLFMSLASLIRIFFIVPAFLYFASYFFLKGKKNFLLRIIPMVVSIIAITSHIFFLHTYFSPVIPEGLLTKYGGEGFLFLKKIFSFSSPFYSHWEILLPLCLGLSIFALAKMKRRDIQFFLTSYILFFIVFFYIKGSGLRNYWSILVTPVILLTGGLFPLAVQEFLDVGKNLSFTPVHEEGGGT